MGAGFGTPVQNAKVEAAAVRTFKYKYRKWNVVDRQKDNVGYDFEVNLKSQERHIELKGVSGPMPTFIVTQNERKVATHDPLWRLCVVSNALSAKPVVSEWSADEFLRSFDLRAISYMARLQG